MTNTIHAIPATMCDERIWQPLQPHLDQSLSTTHIPIETVKTFDQMTDIVANRLLSPGVLLGFSLGGYVAMQFALKHPEKVDKLVIIASSAMGLSKQERLKREFFVSLMEKSGGQYGGIALPQINALLSEQARQSTQIVKTIEDMDRDLGVEVLLSQVHQTTYRPSLFEQLPSIQCPVLLVGAVQDDIVDVKDLEKMAQQLRQAQLAVIPNCGHMIPLECPQQLAQQINDFLL